MAVTMSKRTCEVCIDPEPLVKTAEGPPPERHCNNHTLPTQFRNVSNTHINLSYMSGPKFWVYIFQFCFVFILMKTSLLSLQKSHCINALNLCDSQLLKTLANFFKLNLKFIWHKCMLLF